MSFDSARVAARQAALAGEFALARGLATALLQANSDDRAALIVLSAVEPRLGDARAGRRAGARAFRLSQDDGERYEAARLTALAAANEERYTLSQFWLRRAAVNAPNDRAFEQTQLDYRGIRNLNPWSMDLGLSVRPSNNVNGGSETEYNIIDGLPFIGVLSGDAQALPGVAATADLRLAYALTRTADQTTNLTVRAYARAVWLNDEARAIAPASRNSDFGSQVLELGVAHQRRVGEAILSFSALSGASWFGGEASSDYHRATLGYNLPVSDTLRATFSGQVQQTNVKGGNPHTNLLSGVSAGLTYQVADGNRLRGTLSFETQSSDDSPNERYETLTAQVSYDWAEPLGPVQLSVAAGIAQSEYPDYTIILPVPGGRQDTRVFGNVTAVFHQIDYAGFVPVVTLGVQDTNSNVSRFERNEYSLNIGIRSSF